MTDREVIEAIRANHLKANISNAAYVRHYWDQAWVDPGGTFFGPGPYVKLPVDWLVDGDPNWTERLVIRVHAPSRLRQQLAKRWRPR